MAKLSSDEVNAGLASLEGWSVDGDAIVKEFGFGGFPDAVAFVVRVGFSAEAADHHPDLDIRYDRVRAALSTHSEGGITGNDLDLAAKIEAAATR